MPAHLQRQVEKLKKQILAQARAEEALAAAIKSIDYGDAVIGPRRESGSPEPGRVL